MTSYTKAELRQFERITRATSTPNSPTNRFGRNIARLDLSLFIEKHGLKKCEAMDDAIKARFVTLKKRLKPRDGKLIERGEA